jgi:hypothetical protein
LFVFAELPLPVLGADTPGPAPPLVGPDSLCEYEPLPLLELALLPPPELELEEKLSA